MTGSAQHLPNPYRVRPLTAPPDAVLELPGSKSHTNRALVCAALANGRSQMRRMLFANDTDAMLDSIGRLGAVVERSDGSGGDGGTGHGQVIVQGGLASGPTGSSGGERLTGGGELVIDVQQSGTTGRFLLPVLAALPGRFVLDGDPQLRARPFGPQLAALRHLGAQITGEGLPLRIDGTTLVGGSVEVAASLSSQFLSGILLAAPLFARSTIISLAGDHVVSQPYVALTLSTMAQFGVAVEVESDDDGVRYRTPSQHYRAADVDLEPDASAASYFFAAAAMTGGRVRINGLGTETVQGDLQFVRVLERMGASVEVTRDWTEVRGPQRLRGVDVDMADISDTAQTLAVVAAVADGPTRIRGIGFIRHKETDRIMAPVNELNRLGVRAEADEDGLTIYPQPDSPNASRSIVGRVETYDDHRMAMSFSLLGLQHQGVEIADPGCVAKTFPTFFSYLESLG